MDEIALDVERQLVVELRIDRVRRQREQNVVAVGGCLRRDVRAHVAPQRTPLLSMMIGCPRLYASASFMMRATTSVPPPGGYGTMNRMGRLG
jgi:hypothetical protein